MSRASDAFNALCAGMVAALAFFPPAVEAQQFSVLHSFHGTVNDGRQPFAGVIRDEVGNLYGTTWHGGYRECRSGCGTVFKLAPDGTETLLHRFNVNDGAMPGSGGVIADATGTLYGTTTGGGVYGQGTVFKLAPDGTETVVHSFHGVDGSNPAQDLILDPAGNLYGVTNVGGAGGHGTVFKLTSDGTLSVLHAFAGPPGDGSEPYGGVIADAAGNLYGTTPYGGADDSGTVFRLAPDGTETVLYSFSSLIQGCLQGCHPVGGLTLDAAGNLYGTAERGGTGRYGMVFKLAPDGTLSVLHYFSANPDGAYPDAGLVFDRQGNLYGTTSYGGAYGFGTIFKVKPNGHGYSILHSFDGSDGNSPRARLIVDRSDLYGTTLMGGSHNIGVVFQLRK